MLLCQIEIKIFVCRIKEKSYNMEFRPCIDIHNGRVKQIVGSSLQGNNTAAGNGDTNGTGNDTGSNVNSVTNGDTNADGNDSILGDAGNAVGDPQAVIMDIVRTMREANNNVFILFMISLLYYIYFAILNQTEKNK